ncbi:hypothetical protein YC2023_016031 [Brassica napus]
MEHIPLIQIHPSILHMTTKFQFSCQVNNKMRNIFSSEIPMVVLVFSTRTHMWVPGMTNLDVPAGSFMGSYGCMVMGNKIYANKFVYDPTQMKLNGNAR